MKFHCTGHKPAIADSHDEAAAIFAGRIARARFGKRGTVGALKAGLHTIGGDFCEWEALIGRRLKCGAVEGYNIRLNTHTYTK